MAEEAQNNEQEPTMEEILASIRKIISDGDVDEEGSGKTAEPDFQIQATDDDDATESLDELVAKKPTAIEDEDEEPLELTEMVNDDGSTTDVSELDNEEDIDDDLADNPMPDNEPDEEFEIMDAEPEPEPASLPPIATTLSDLNLVSNRPATETASSFAHLAGAVSATQGIPIGAGNKTLEDLVKELLRPMLKEWLDENLPPLVERLVEREINKLAGQIEKK
jgi:cell pole-organizing protein PopZ